jgi:hypothetical protein
VLPFASQRDGVRRGEAALAVTREQQLHAVDACAVVVMVLVITIRRTIFPVGWFVILSAIVVGVVR